MKIVYVVNCYWLGAYPKIAGVFSSKDLANKYISEMENEEGYSYQIEEFEVDVL